jgi:hypothetical protein
MGIKGVRTRKKTNNLITHKQLCRIAAQYLAGHRFNCPVVVTEFSSIKNYEIPDALGFDSNGKSYLIECKISRSDFLADKNKIFRQNFGELGIGNERYYLVPAGMVEPNEVPEKWGLIEQGEHNILMTKKPEYFDSNRIAENQILISAIRRLKLSTAVFVQPENGFSENFEPQGEN